MHPARYRHYERACPRLVAVPAVSLVLPFAASVAAAPVRSAFADDPEYRDLLTMFVAAVPDRRRALARAWEAGNFPELRVLAHQLKGAGGGFGFYELTRLASDLESACRSAEPPTIAAALTQVLAYLQRITC